jgi:hypothetical protein
MSVPTYNIYDITVESMPDGVMVSRRLVGLNVNRATAYLYAMVTTGQSMVDVAAMVRISEGITCIRIPATLDDAKANPVELEPIR